MTLREVYTKIIDDLSSSTQLGDFKYLKSRKTFIKYDALGSYGFEIRYWDWVNDNDYPAICINPIVFRRFDILHKWYEPIGRISLKDQRQNVSLMKKTQDFFENKYVFSLDMSDYSEVIKQMLTVFYNECNIFWQRYTTLDAMWKDVKNIMQNGIDEFKPGAEWIFEWMALCLIVSPNDYSSMKTVIKKHIEISQQGKYPEPNIRCYYDRFDEIFDYLEHYDFTKEKQKVGLI